MQLRRTTFRFVARKIHALNHIIRRGIINVLNRSGHDHDTHNDDMNGGNTRRRSIEHERQSSGKSFGVGKRAAAGNANLFRSDEEFEEDQANIHELENNLKMADEELHQLRKNSKSLAEENSQMKIDMNRAVIELEQLLNQLGQLKSQLNELKCENKALACEKELHDLENKPHDYLNDDYLKEGETSNPGSSLAGALQKYKIGPEARDEPSTQSAGDSSGDVNASKKLPLVGGAFGLFGRRSNGTGQTTDEANHNAEESKGVLGGLFNRGDSGRGSPGPVGDDAASPQNSPVPQRRGLFFGIRNNQSSEAMFSPVPT
jgi:regulator of replication initiation timing